MSLDPWILSIFDILAPCFQVIELASLSQQSFRAKGLKMSVIFSLMRISDLVKTVLIRSLVPKAVLKSPSRTTWEVSYKLLSLSILFLTSLKKVIFSCPCAHGACIFAIITVSSSLFSIMRRAHMWASLPILHSSTTLMFSLRRVIIPPLFPVPSVNTWFPFHVYFSVLCSRCVSCNATINVPEPLCDLCNLFISCLNFVSFFRPRQFKEIRTLPPGPGLSSTTPAIFRRDLLLSLSFSTIVE